MMLDEDAKNIIKREGPSECWVFSNPHHRSILCLDVDDSGTYCVTGSADHTLRVWNLLDRQLKAELYSRKYGHYEWVTCCAFTSNNTIISGGMDGKICIWNTQTLCKPPHNHRIYNTNIETPTADTIKRWQQKIECRASTNRSTCREIDAHTNSVAAFVLDEAMRVGVSGGYDGKLCVWGIKNAKKLETLRNVSSSSPVMKLCKKSHSIVSGDRGGSVSLWDVNCGELVTNFKHVHNGAIGDLCITSRGSDGSYIILSCGLNDGTVCLIDSRAGGRAMCSIRAHEKGVTKLLLLGTSEEYICSLSGDGSSSLYDISTICSSLKSQPIANVKFSDAVFCGDSVANLQAVVGTGDGNIYPVDFNRSFDGFDDTMKGRVSPRVGEVWWGYGCEKRGAVHAIKAIRQRSHQSPVVGAVAGGDDGSLAYLRF